jgi:Zn-dependent peptidase ImmA (M78 family)
MFIQDQMHIIREHQKNYPVKVAALAEALGVPVYNAGGWKDNVSGMIIKDKENLYDAPSGYAIFVNKNHTKTRKRFTIAHELAHFILHKDKIGNGVSDDILYRSGLSNRVEVEANKWAADILMPWDLVVDAMQDGHTELEDLAKVFEVSKSAMAIRLGSPYEM